MLKPKNTALTSIETCGTGHQLACARVATVSRPLVTSEKQPGSSEKRSVRYAS